MAKILIVEDEKALSDAYALVLKNEGHHIDTAHNGEEAIDKFKKDKPELVLLDLRMPKMDGIEFLKKIDPVNKNSSVQVIVFSNYDNQREIEDAYKYGATKYILKAWASPKELIRLSEEALSV